MEATARTAPLPASSRYGELLVGLGLLVILALMLVPLPTLVLDLLLVFDMMLALLILLLTVYVQKPVELSVFPSVLLLCTLLRLALNVAATRLVLLNGYAGQVIAAFGSFVVGGNYAVGLVIFTILTVIQFLVITKGAGRVAEVAARFTLDGMPGRQMAIDADLNAGHIDEAEARRRRLELSREADFYGAMDGASKFVRGDAIAAVIIILVNIVGGLVVGVVQMGMSAGDALRQFTLLTVGDGLVAQIPALIISTASGIIITRVSGSSNLGAQILKEMLVKPRALLLTGGLLFSLAVVPGLPKLPFLAISAVAVGLGLSVRRTQQRQHRAGEREKREKAAARPEEVEKLLPLDALQLEIGYALIPLVDEKRGGDLLSRVTLVRRQSALELGLVVPPIRIRDNLRLRPAEYSLQLRGTELARGEVRVGQYLALDPGTAEGPLPGVKTKDPVFGLPAVWIEDADKPRAEAAGYTVVECAAVIATHLSETIKSHAHEILTRQETQTIIQTVKATHPAVVEELIPNLLSVGGVQKVLQRLLRERISIRDMVTILEALADHAPAVKDPDALAEFARQALSRSIVRQYQDARGQLPVITLDATLEQELVDRLTPADGGHELVLEPAALHLLLRELRNAVQTALTSTSQPVLLCSHAIRTQLRRLTEKSFPNLVVLSYREVAAAESVHSVAAVRKPHAD
ncbi:MAG TPA: flagellar biosynthesis protein FlhA [Candidatus Saccharimonadales bacterium]|nr:flagellar biosynthesis protein FlhA [Candidatus Saccharimonadales bacterium]